MMKLLIMVFCLLLFTSVSIGNGDMDRHTSRRKNSGITITDESDRETDSENRTTEGSTSDVDSEPREGMPPE